MVRNEFEFAAVTDAEKGREEEENIEDDVIRRTR